MAVGPAEQALHQSGLRCAEIDTGLECTRRLSDGWRQVARLEVAGGAVQGLEVRLVPGTAAFPVADAPAALSEPADDVLGVDLSEVVDQAVAADGAACDCTRPVEGGAVHVEGDPVAGYLLTIEVPDEGCPSNTSYPSGRRVRQGRTKPAMKPPGPWGLAGSRAWLFAGGERPRRFSGARRLHARIRSPGANTGVVALQANPSSIIRRAPAPVAAGVARAVEPEPRLLAAGHVSVQQAGDVAADHRAMLEAVARSAPDEPHVVERRMAVDDEVRVRRRLVLAGAGLEDRPVGEVREAAREVAAGEADRVGVRRGGRPMRDRMARRSGPARS